MYSAHHTHYTDLNTAGRPGRVGIRYVFNPLQYSPMQPNTKALINPSSSYASHLHPSHRLASSPENLIAVVESPFQSPGAGKLTTVLVGTGAGNGVPVAGGLSTCCGCGFGWGSDRNCCGICGSGGAGVSTLGVRAGVCERRMDCIELTMSLRLHQLSLAIMATDWGKRTPPPAPPAPSSHTQKPCTRL